MGTTTRVLIVYAATALVTMPLAVLLRRLTGWEFQTCVGLCIFTVLSGALAILSEVVHHRARLGTACISLALLALVGGIVRDIIYRSASPSLYAVAPLLALGASWLMWARDFTRPRRASSRRARTSTAEE